VPTSYKRNEPCRLETSLVSSNFAVDLTSPKHNNKRIVELTEKSGTSLSVQNEACLGTISFISETLKDKAIKQHSKEPSSLWKTWEVTDDFGYLTVLYDYGFEGEDGEAEVE
jgi:hypothetical protein